MRRSLITCCLIALLGGLIICSLHAQSNTGTIHGQATDDAGGPLPDVQVTIKNLNTNVTTVVRTDTNGFLTVPGLPPGQYSVNSLRPGFQSLSVEVSVAVGEQRAVDLHVSPGDPNHIIHTKQVSAGLATTGSSTGGVTDSNTVRDLASNGRDWTQAATLQAGVSSVKTQPDAGNTNSGRGQRGFGSQISVSGGRPQQNNYILNGISINDYANSAPGSVLGLDLGADAVEQFSVVTSNYPAEYGRCSGGIINAATRSGSNAFHGSVYEFLRNSALDAKNYFDGPKPPFKRNQFGGAIGGPILKNRTFFFVNYEGLRQSLGVTHIDTVPSLAARSGMLSTGQVQVDPEAARYLIFFPLPNRGLIGNGDTGNFAFSGQVITPENYFTTRIDHKFSARDLLVGSYVFDQAQTTQPDQFNLRLNQLKTKRNVLSFQENHTFRSTLLNSFRVGVNRVVAEIGLTPAALQPIAADTSYGFLPGKTSGNINIAGLTNFTGGLGAASPYNFHWTSVQAYDDVSWSRGKHSVHFGVAFERMLDNMFANADPNGIFVFNSLADFLTNQPYGLNLGIPGTATPRDLRESLFGGYIQDDVHWSPNLTVNLGLRYEMSTVPTEVAGKLSALRNISDPVPHLGSPYFANPTLANFEPRVGFAWDPLGNGRLAVRSGFGIFDVLPLPYEFELLSLGVAPFFENATPTQLPAGSFFAGAIQIARNANTLRYAYIEPNPRRNYVMQWNLNLEVQTTKSSSILLAYVGSRGVHQPFRANDTNLVLPTRTPQGYAWPFPIGSGIKINPDVGRIDGLLWRGDSYYDALQLQAHATFSNRLQLQASYTWGKSIDTGSATIAGDQFANSVSSLPWYDLRLGRGPSDFNVGQSFSARFTYQLPPIAGSHSWYVMGWRLAATYQASTGSPFTPVIAGDPLGSKSSDPYGVPNLLAFPGCTNPTNPGNPALYLKTQCFAFPNLANVLGNLHRNSIVGPGLSDLDFSLFKDNPLKRISETFNLQLRVEIFNMLNHPNFSPPLDHRALFNATGNLINGAGQIDITATSSRQMQLGLKVIW
jgi:hypothetical protein